MAITYLFDQGLENRNCSFFTDSKITLGQLESGWKIRTNKKSLFALKSLRATLPNSLFLKVPAHIGVMGNEKADSLANHGSARSPPPAHSTLFSYQTLT